MYDLQSKLAHLVTRWDRQQEARCKYHNRYALGIYLGAVESTVADVAKGYDVNDALARNFNDRLLTFLLKHVDGQMPAV